MKDQAIGDCPSVPWKKLLDRVELANLRRSVRKSQARARLRCREIFKAFLVASSRRGTIQERSATEVIEGQVAEASQALIGTSEASLSVVATFTSAQSEGVDRVRLVASTSNRKRSSAPATQKCPNASMPSSSGALVVSLIRAQQSSIKGKQVEGYAQRRWPFLWMENVNQFLSSNASGNDLVSFCTNAHRLEYRAMLKKVNQRYLDLLLDLDSFDNYDEEILTNVIINLGNRFREPRTKDNLFVESLPINSNKESD
ncbi:hypothetical protein ACH5RR_028719 [Cinchona calisaya]|uniref:Uncharacterized protein n=1 Tax=Cinchona calisaya TaxID=153742 RepID=A0ABD2YQU4_9GENT